MARGQQLKDKMIEAFKEPRKYGDGCILYLHVTKLISKNWLYLYRRLDGDQMRGDMGGHQSTKHYRSRLNSMKCWVDYRGPSAA